MSPWKVILATMVIFVCGVVTGALVIRTHDGRPLPPSRAPGEPGVGIPGSAPVWEVLRRLAPLGLTTNQSAKIAKIMQDSQATNAAIRTTIAPLLQREVERAHQAINQVLTPEQQKKYAELLKRPEPRPEGRGRRGGEGGPFPPRNTNRPQTNGMPGEGRGRTSRTSGANNLSTNSIPSNNIPTNNIPTNSIPAINVPTNNIPTNSGP